MKKRMNKMKKPKIKKTRRGKGLWNGLKLKGKFIMMISVPVIITFVVTAVSIAIIVPDIVNDLKKENARLELNIIESYLESLQSEAIHGCDYLADKENLKQAMFENDTAKIKTEILAATTELWTNESKSIPDFITVTDTDGNIVAFFVKDDNTTALFKTASPEEKFINTSEIREALNGRITSAYRSNFMSAMYYNTAKPILSPDGSTLTGTVSIGYRLDSVKHVDEIKGDKDIDVSFFLGETRIVTTLKAENGTRRTGTSIDKKIWKELWEGADYYIDEVEIFGEKSVGVYLPLYNDNEVAGVLGAAVPVANLTSIYAILIIMAFVVVALIVVFLIMVGRTILMPVLNIVDAANSLADGDVSFSIKEIESNDEIGLLIQSFKTMAENIKKQAELVERISSGDISIEITPKSEKDILGGSLKTMIDSNNLIFSEIISTAEQVAVAAKQIADGSQELSLGTTQQAAAVEELTDSVMQIAEKATNNEQHVNKTNRLIRVINDHAEKGTADMNEMLTAVKEIENSSTNISKVIRAIDDIAFQTNMLALNAAVEAARAGENGRGFAVVAEEVRILAAKSAKAAKETNEMIDESIVKATQGKEIAVKTSDTFNTIAKGVREIEKLITEIDASSKDQTISTKAATNSADSVSRVVQTNAATAEQSAAASQEMSSQANALTDLIKNQFKLKVSAGNMTSELPEEELKQEFGKY